jgi:protein-L-isoaspartate(D-aspartate) O-methyltransferase
MADTGGMIISNRVSALLTLFVGVLAAAHPACAQTPEAARAALIEELVSQGIVNPAVLDAIGRVERHRFVPAQYRSMAYDNRPLPIGEEQTISQPYIVAYMTEMLQLEPTDRVLEIGTGSGYQASILGELSATVYSIEIVEILGRRAEALLAELGYSNIHVRIGDGYQGWPEHAPFDAIIVTAAPGHIPQPLVEQLAVGGRMVVPVGGERQTLTLIERTAEGVTITRDLPVRFVPMTGEAERP